MAQITAKGGGMIIEVNHVFSNGWHEFTSPQVPGLYVVAEEDDLEAAYEDVPMVIAQLIEADFGNKVTIVLRPSFSEYIDGLNASVRPSMRHYSVEQIAA